MDNNESSSNLEKIDINDDFYNKLGYLRCR